MAAICALMGAGHALALTAAAAADPAPGKDQPAARPATDEGTKADPSAEEKAKAEEKAGLSAREEYKSRLKKRAQQLEAGKAPRTSKARKAVDLTPDPNAKWSCEKTSVTVEPQWRSASGTLDFPFVIKNVGTAPLEIRAKGG